jgi:hypothetical protein
MTTRRIAYWWFRFVFSGRFLETFLVGRHRPLMGAGRLGTVKPQHEPAMSRSDEAVRAPAE